MKVWELIDLLRRCDPHDRVVVSGNGDIASVGRKGSSDIDGSPSVVVTSREDKSLILPNPGPRPFWLPR